MKTKNVIDRTMLLFGRLFGCLGIPCIVADSRDELLKRLFEKKMRYSGMAIVRSRYLFSISYINTVKMLFSN